MASTARSNAVLIEIEGVLNGRPLAYLNDEEYCDSLTSNHLVHGKGIFNRSNNQLNEIGSRDDCREIVQN